jgi:adenosylhomocysteine nucleosidase
VRSDGTRRPLVVFALGREAMFFRRRWVREAIPGAPCRAWAGRRGERSIRVVETGVGAEAAERALTWALATPGERPELVLMAGFAGGLDPELRVGDLVAATEIRAETEGRWACYPLPVSGAVKGQVLCTAAMVCEPDHKNELHQRFQAIAVEMESATVARMCAAHAIPFACLRAVSDARATPLSPDLPGLLQGGRVTPTRLLWALLRQPALLGDLLQLASATRLAAARLSEGLLAVLDP